MTSRSVKVGSARVLRPIAAAQERTGGHSVPCEIDPGRLAELTLALGRSKVEQLLTLLSGELASRPALLKAAAVAGDHCAARAHAHSLKGAIANFGGQDAVSAAEALQTCPRGKPMILAMRRFDAEIERFSRALERLLGHDILAERRSA